MMSTMSMQSTGPPCPKSLIFLDAKSIYQCRDDRFGKAAGDAQNRRIFLIKKIARVVGKFEFAAEDEVLIVVNDTVVMLIAHRNRRRYRDFEYAGASFVVQQHAAKPEALYHAVDNRVGALAIALNPNAVTTMNQLVHHRLGETVLNFETEGVILKRRNGYSFDVRRQLAFGH